MVSRGNIASDDRYRANTELSDLDAVGRRGNCIVGGNGEIAGTLVININSIIFDPIRRSPDSAIGSDGDGARIAACVDINSIAVGSESCAVRSENRTSSGGNFDVASAQMVEINSIARRINVPVGSNGKSLGSGPHGGNGVDSVVSSRDIAGIDGHHAAARVLDPYAIAHQSENVGV